MKIKAIEISGAAKAGRLLQAKKRAISLLDRCLGAHNLNIQEHEEILLGTFCNNFIALCDSARGDVSVRPMLRVATGPNSHSGRQTPLYVPSNSLLTFSIYLCDNISSQLRSSTRFAPSCDGMILLLILHASGLNIPSHTHICLRTLIYTTPLPCALQK